MRRRQKTISSLAEDVFAEPGDVVINKTTLNGMRANAWMNNKWRGIFDIDDVIKITCCEGVHNEKVG